MPFPTSAIVASVSASRGAAARTSPKKRGPDQWAPVIFLAIFGERRVRRAAILEPIFRHRDGVRASLPFAYQPGHRASG